MLRVRLATVLAVSAMAVTACTSGGPDSPASTPAPTPTPTPPPTTSPTVQVLPASYDFGKVTVGNTPAPLEVTIRNTGTAALAVSNIAFAAPASPGFSIALSGGAKPCGSAAPTIAAGDSCTFQISFQSATAGAFTGSVQINSNDAANRAIGVPLVAALEAVGALTVRINQLQTACPTNQVTAYVSVTDQGGYPVTGLTASNFTVTQDTTARTITSASYIEVAYQPIAVAGALDHSNSVTGQPVAFGDMKNAFTSFFNDLRTGDLGEVVKFGASVEVSQAFTADKAKLSAAIAAPFSDGTRTRLYDAAVQSSNDTAVNTAYRRAVIIATDGADNASTSTLTDAMDNAKSKGVPLFTIGIGDQINKTVLSQIASTTGGLYYEANTSQNLATIYQQLSAILYQKQYVVKFDQSAKGSPGVSSSVLLGASSQGLSGSATAGIASCN